MFLQGDVTGALRVVSCRALGRPAFTPSPSVLPSPTPSPPSSSSAPLGSSSVAASSIVVSRSRATHDALPANDVRGVGVHAERDARAISGTPTTPSRIDDVADTVRRNVIVDAEAEQAGHVATTTLSPCRLHGVEAVGAAAEVDAAGDSGAPTASRAPFPAVLAQEADGPPQAPCASSVNGFLCPAIPLIVLLLLLLIWRILWEEACAEAVSCQAMASASVWVQVDSLVPTVRGEVLTSWAAVPAARHRSVRPAAEGCLSVSGMEAHADSVWHTRLDDPMSSTPAVRGAAGCDTTRGSGISAPSGPIGPGGGQVQAA